MSESCMPLCAARVLSPQVTLAKLIASANEAVEEEKRRERMERKNMATAETELRDYLATIKVGGILVSACACVRVRACARGRVMTRARRNLPLPAPFAPLSKTSRAPKTVGR